MRVFATLDEFVAASGTDLGSSDWLTVDQKRIDTFAEATGDHQWIHVDPEKAASGPFGTTIAHGLLTLSLYPVLMFEVYEVQNIKMGLNYGFNKVRFPSPVPVDSEVRLTVSIGEVTTFNGGAQAIMPSVMEIKGAAKPAAVLEAIVRFIA
ncbi:MaoC family dehydratase [Sporichthya sp.]|uniref:MaoC family dehydratase n=1 Tax=Sporichthya sp. TaxID=65475 RepID=UPI0017A45745|nr:MaoC family dehydratase [Sporichthya sp.]MBA3741871.1 MaoC family dehydratase [Sporichthya sp.]